MTALNTVMTGTTARQDDWSFHLCPQVTQDVIPTSPVFNELHLRTSGVAIDSPEYTQSSAITVSGQPRTNIKTGTSYAAELAAEGNTQQATLMSAAMESATTNLTETASTIASTATGFDDSAGTAFADYAVGDFLFATGFAAASNNTIYLITEKTDDGTVVTSPVPAVAAAEGIAVTLTSYKAALSKEPTLFVGQNRVKDLSQETDIAYETFINGFSTSYALTIPESGIITATLNMVFEMKNQGLLPIAGQTNAALQTGQVATTPLLSVWLDTVKSTTCFLKNMDLTIDNGYTANLVAQCESRRQGKAIPTVGGSLSTVMFTENTYEWKSKVDTNTPFALAVGIDFKDGKYMIISMPRVKATSWSADGDTAMANSMDFSCEPDQVTGKAIQIFANFPY